MHLSHISQYTIQNRNVHISVLNCLLWDMGQLHGGICETGLFTMMSWYNQEMSLFRFVHLRFCVVESIPNDDIFMLFHGHSHSDSDSDSDRDRDRDREQLWIFDFELRLMYVIWQDGVKTEYSCQHRIRLLNCMRCIDSNESEISFIKHSKFFWMSVSYGFCIHRLINEWYFCLRFRKVRVTKNSKHVWKMRLQTLSCYVIYIQFM